MLLDEKKTYHGNVDKGILCTLTSLLCVGHQPIDSGWSHQDDFGYAVTKLIFLNERPMSASSVGANLVSCNASGWVSLFRDNFSH